MSAPISCPVCGGARAELFRTHSAGRLLRCAVCALVWLDPPPDRATLDTLYADPYQGATLSYFTKVERKLQRSAGRVRQIMSALGTPPKGRHFLDVGANGGFMSEAARRAGFEVTGVEPDGKSLAYAAEHYPGIRFVQGFLEDADLPPESFDAVYCSEVIEHSGDCNLFVAALARAMKPGAILYLTTPDIGHWRRPREIEKWDAFCPPAHCLYFSPGNLKDLLGRHGLDVVKRRIAFKPGIKFIVRKREAVARVA